MTSSQSDEDPHHEHEEPEDVLALVGAWGSTQKYIFFCLQFSMLMLSWQTLNMTFLAPSVDHWCVTPEEGPLEEPGGPGHCEGLRTENGSSPSPCVQWGYSHEQFHSTLTEKYDLVCERSWTPSLLKSLFMFGALLMSPIAGSITDRFGRRIASLITSVPCIFGNGLLLANQNLHMLMVGQFLNGISAGCAVNSIYVLFTELTEGRRRYALSVSVDIGFAVGSALLGLVSWALRDWFHIQILGFILAWLPFLFAWFLPESPSWLIINGHTEKAVNNISKIAKRNGRTIVGLADKIRGNAKFVKNRAHSGDERRGLTALFSTSPRLKRTLVILYVRFAIGVVYYGIAMNVKFFGESLFTDFLLSSVLAVPSTLSAICLVLRGVSVRCTLLGFLTLETVVCLLFAVVLGFQVNISGAHTALVVLGWLFAAPCMPLVVQLTAELYPTVIRGTVTGLGFFVTRLGCIVAIYCKELGEKTSPYIPVLLFGILILGAILSLFLLPEDKPCLETCFKSTSCSSTRRKPHQESI